MKRFIPTRKKSKPTPALRITVDPTLALIIKKCGGNLELVVKYILSATEQDAVCELCSHKTSGDCTGLADCAAAVAKYIEERDGHA